MHRAEPSRAARPARGPSGPACLLGFRHVRT
jgi:hypothetical protein